jgi:hypothetical protein
MSDDDLTAAAAALAERILDDVSSEGQDWGTIAACARALAALADAAASGSCSSGTES